MVDYDLVILGGAPEGRIAALTATAMGARVALVEPPGRWQQQRQTDYLLQGLRQVGQQRQSAAAAFWSQSGGGSLDWSRLLRWSAIAAESEASIVSAAVLGARGVDLILAPPVQLASSPSVRVATQQRRLLGRGLLIATGTVPDYPNPNRQAALSGAPDCLYQHSALPQRIAIFGGSLTALAWAQALRAAGAEVSLIAPRLLPGEDSDIRRLLLGQLTAEGIGVTPSSSAEKAERQLSLHIQKPPPDCCLVLSPQQVAWSQQLAAAGIPLQTGRLCVNRYLQTAQSRVFACGSVLGGLDHSALAALEAETAVHNALFWPRRTIQYQTFPYSSQTQPPVGRVGLTEVQARQRYGGEVQVLTASAANAASLNAEIPHPSFCKLICLENGRLLGAHLLGVGAGEVAYGLALWLKSGTSVDRLPSRWAHFEALSPTLTSLLQRAVSQRRQARWQIGSWRRDSAENWFNWRRSRL